MDKELDQTMTLNEQQILRKIYLKEFNMELVVYFKVINFMVDKGKQVKFDVETEDGVFNLAKDELLILYR